MTTPKTRREFLSGIALLTLLCSSQTGLGAEAKSAETTVTIDRAPLSEGQHTLGMAVRAEPFGLLAFEVTDTIGKAAATIVGRVETAIASDRFHCDTLARCDDATIRACGARARTVRPDPVSNPPPPTGASTRSGVTPSSIASSTAVPWPAITSASS